MKSSQLAILLIDDDSDILEVISAAIESDSNYNVTKCADPEIALELIENENYDVIISDYKMPVISGFAIYSKLRESEWAQYRDIPFVFCTGYPDELAQHDIDADTWIIEKPLKNDTLERIIDGIARARKSA